MKKRKFGQKVALFFTYFSYISAVFTLVFCVYWGMTEGTENPIFASLLASVVFFISCGVVLQVIANANLPDLSIKLE